MQLEFFSPIALDANKDQEEHIVSKSRSEITIVGSTLNESMLDLRLTSANSNYNTFSGDPHEQDDSGSTAESENGSKDR